MAQLLPQVIGIAAVGIFVFGIAIAGWAIIKAIVGLRVSEEEEFEGLDLGEHGNIAYPDFQPVTVGSLHGPSIPTVGQRAAGTVPAMSLRPEKA